MTAWGVLGLAALAGLNPWLVLLLTAGLATFTRHAPVTAEALSALGLPVIGVLALLLGVDLVASKVQHLTRVVEWVDLVGGAAAGALLGAVLVAGAPMSGWWVIPVAAAVAVLARLARWAVRRPVERSLKPLGHVAMSIFSDLLAGTLCAGVFAIKP
jgi:hypothetical protein